MVQFSGIIVLPIVFLLVRFFSGEALFSSDTKTLSILLATQFVLHSTLFILCEVFKSKKFYDISRYLWVPFWLSFLYYSGGIYSQFIFILIFPILVSAADLNEKETRVMGIILALGLASLIFAIPTDELTKEIIVRHLVVTFLYAYIAYYVHRIVKDTLRHQYERELAERRLKELKDFNDIKEDFLKVAEHQLRTPLSGVRWALQTLKNNPSLGSDGLKLVADTSKKLDEAMSIVGEMLQTAEIDVKTLVIKGVTVDLEPLIKDIFEELRYLLEKNKVKINFKFEPNLAVKGDRKLLVSALTNVLDNAIRYSPEGSVTVNTNLNNRNVEIEIKDTGIGITSEDLPFVFERFHRGKEAVSIDPNESGIGLYVTKKIIELHNGGIYVSSKKGEGTTVKILLPKSS